jgi:hypothetical protein
MERDKEYSLNDGDSFSFLGHDDSRFTLVASLPTQPHKKQKIIEKKSQKEEAIEVKNIKTLEDKATVKNPPKVLSTSVASADRSLAFCSISTSVFQFDIPKAAQVACKVC